MKVDLSFWEGTLLLGSTKNRSRPKMAFDSPWAYTSPSTPGTPLHGKSLGCVFFSMSWSPNGGALAWPSCFKRTWLCQWLSWLGPPARCPLTNLFWRHLFAAFVVASLESVFFFHKQRNTFKSNFDSFQGALLIYY